MELGRSVLPSTASSAVGAGGTIRSLGVTLGWAGGGDGVEDHSQGREPGHLAALRAGRWHPRETVGPEHGFFPQEQCHSGSVVLAVLFSSALFLFYFQ